MTSSLKKIIFIVDDVEESREFLKAIIESEVRKLQNKINPLNLSFELFRSGFDVIAKTRFQKPDLLVIDDLMPDGLRGRDVIKQILQDELKDESKTDQNEAKVGTSIRTKTILITGISNPVAPAISRPEYERSNSERRNRQGADAFEKELRSIIHSWNMESQ